jgi:RNA polymerase sigma factor for flagellar operon FliA
MFALATAAPEAPEVRPAFDHAFWTRFVHGEVERTIRSQRLPRALYEDIRAQAFLGLAEALARYDPDHEAAFRGFARLRVRGAIIDAVRSLGRLSRRGYAAARCLAADAGTETCQVVHDLLVEAAEHTVTSTPTPEQQLVRQELLSRLDAALASLGADDRALVGELYGLDDTPKLGIDVAADRGTSPSTVSREHRRILRRLRSRMEGVHG